MSKQGDLTLRSRVGSYWRRMFPGSTAHVHTDLRKFEKRLAAYRAASRTERLEAVVVLTERSARASSSAPSTILGAGVAAIAAAAGLMGTYTLFLQQSVIAVARDAQARADALKDAGRDSDAADAVKAIRQVGSSLNTGTDTIFLIVGVVVAAILIGWLVATDHARQNSVARAWLLAYERVDAEIDTQPGTLERRRPWRWGNR